MSAAALMLAPAAWLKAPVMASGEPPFTVSSPLPSALLLFEKLPLMVRAAPRRR